MTLRRHVVSVAIGALLVPSVLMAAGSPASAGSAGPAGSPTAGAIRAHIAAVKAAPWGHWAQRAAAQTPGGLRAAGQFAGLQDPVGDEVDFNGLPGNEPRADLVAASARDTSTTITLTAATAVLSNPMTDPNWASGSTGPTWTLWPTGDPTTQQPIAFVSLTSFAGQLQGSVEVLQSGPGLGGTGGLSFGGGCNATGGFAASGADAGYSVTFPASCLGQLGRFFWSASMTYDPATDVDGSLSVGDQAPNTGAFPEVDDFPAVQGYWLAATDGGVFSHGSAVFHGSEGAVQLDAPVVAAAATPDGRGYFLATADGGVFTHGDAVFHGSAGSRQLTSPVVGIAVTPDGGGYLLIAANGGVFSFGDAPVLGSEAGFVLTAPLVAAAVTPSDSGYWLFAADGGVFNFGDAGFFGSLGSQHLNRPIVGAAVDPQTGGYWMVAGDGGVFSFHAPFFGSEGATRLAAPVVGISSAQFGTGYRMVAVDGGMFDFGAATFSGSEATLHLNAPVVAAASLES
jgi:hypothetical protein